jgi:hypothetical protein
MVESPNEMYDPSFQINEILLKNSSFYRTSPEDTALYLVDFTVIASLTYQIIQYAANIFGAALPVIGGLTWAYKKFLARPDSNPQSKTVSEDDRVAFPALNATELGRRLEALRGDAQNETLRTELISHIEQILGFHGWPTEEAKTDAQLIVNVLLNPEVTGDGPTT